MGVQIGCPSALSICEAVQREAKHSRQSHMLDQSARTSLTCLWILHWLDVLSWTCTRKMKKLHVLSKSSIATQGHRSLPSEPVRSVADPNRLTTVSKRTSER